MFTLSWFFFPTAFLFFLVLPAASLAAIWIYGFFVPMSRLAYFDSWAVNLFSAYLLCVVLFQDERES
jgi:hypothetical protein